jgi:hypothetical protein
LAAFFFLNYHENKFPLDLKKGILKKTLLNLQKKEEGGTGLRSVSVLTVLIHFHSLWCSSAAWVANGGLCFNKDARLFFLFK